MDRAAALGCDGVGDCVQDAEEFDGETGIQHDSFVKARDGKAGVGADEFEVWVESLLDIGRRDVLVEGGIAFAFLLLGKLDDSAVIDESPEHPDGRDEADGALPEEAREHPLPIRFAYQERRSWWHDGVQPFGDDALVGR